MLKMFVSPYGDDRNDGSEDKPFATLEKARGTIRQLKQQTGLPQGGVTVYLRGGEYPLSESFTLTEEDSGTAEAPIIYQAFPGEKVHLYGGVKLNASDFRSVTDPHIRKRLTCGGSKVLQLDMNELGIPEYGEIVHQGMGYPKLPHSSELFIDDQVMVIARWPNDDMTRIGQVDDPGSNPREGEPPERGARFEFLDDRPIKWHNPDEAWMYGYWYHDWADGNLQIATIDAQHKRIETVQPSFYSVKAGQRYYYYNVLEELDMPGEWFLDRKSNILYVYPPDEFAQSRVMFSLLADALFDLQEASYVTVKNMTFECSRGQGVNMIGGTRNVITGCHFLNLAGLAVTIDGGTEHGVIENRIQNTGSGGIRLSGGDRHTLTPGAHVATDNEISNYCRLRKTYCPAIELLGVGHRVAHNEIYDAPHFGIRLNGNDHTVEFNEIHDILKETSDAGAIYMGRDWSAQGNIIRYNYLYHLQGISEGYGQMGIYLDDMAGDTVIYGNIIRKTDHGLYMGGGRGNRIMNNMILDCNHSIYYDARGLGNWKHTCREGGVMVRTLVAMPYKEEPWRTRYPKLVNILEDRPCAPLYNKIQRNVIMNSPPPNLDPRVVAEAKISNNWMTDTDPGFTDMDGGQLTLKEDAEVFREIPGFEAIPFDKIGIRKRKDKEHQHTR